MCSIKDNDLDLDSDEEYVERCGELFFTTKGRILFHCTLCESKFNGFDQYAAHLAEKHILPNHQCNLEDTDKIQIDDSDVKNACEDVKEDLMAFEFLEPAQQSHFLKDDDTVLLEKHLTAIDAPATATPAAAGTGEKQVKGAVKNLGKPREKSHREVFLMTQVAGNKESIRPSLKHLSTKRNNTENRPHKCPICGTAFKDKHNMLHHLARHSNDRPHQCSQCEKKFYTGSELNVHMRTHTKARPFLCSDCGQTFQTNSQLMNHIKRHTNQRDSKCTQCGKTFFDNRRLKEHMFSHTTERPFACEICPARFVRRTSFKNHMKLHANKAEYKCKLCGVGFNQRAGLLSHSKTKHKI